MKVLALDLSLTATGWARSLSEYGTLAPPAEPGPEPEQPTLPMMEVAS